MQSDEFTSLCKFIQSDEFTSLCELIQSDEITSSYKNSYIKWIHALLVQFPFYWCAYFSSLLVQQRWQNSLVCLWTCTDAPWGMQGRFVCSFPVLLAALLFRGGSRCQDSWIAASSVAWVHVATWIQASLQCKANKSVGRLRWTTWWLSQVVPGSLFETCIRKVIIVKTSLSNNIIPFGTTNVLETLTYKVESGGLSSVSTRN